MESLLIEVNESVKSKNFNRLLHVFETKWHVLGSGEKRTLSSHFVCLLVQNRDILKEALQCDEAMQAILAALSHGPSTIDGGADNILRNLVFDHKVQQEDYTGAARVLAGLKLDDEPSSVYYASPAEKCNVYVKIAECHLEKHDTAEADGAVQKAGSVIEQIQDIEQHHALFLRYKSTYARVLDANRRFFQASLRYHELSQGKHAEFVHPEELLLFFGRAVTCAILTRNVSSHRQRTLGLLYNDERLSSLDSLPNYQAHGNILCKMYKNQLLRQDEVDVFECSLEDHQRAITSDGFTIVRRAVIEHNMVAISALYNSIYFEELAKLLGVNTEKAQKIASEMIVGSKLKGEIDQVDAILNFISSDEGLLAWDQSILSLCVQLNRVTKFIKDADSV